METPEYTKILSKVDAQLEAARAAWEEKAWKIQLEQKLKLIDHQSEELQKREGEFARFGATVPADLVQAIDRLRTERAQVVAGLTPKAPMVPAVLSPMGLLLPAGDGAEMSALLDEVQETDLTPMNAEERWTQFEIWALRWRIVAKRVGNAVIDMSPLAKMVYRIIREKMEGAAFCWYIDSLNPQKEGDWDARLEHCHKLLTKLAVERTQKPEEPVDAPGQALDELFAYLQSPSPEGKSEEEWLRTLRHLARQAGRFAHLREEVAVAVSSYRNVLEPEFAFLWKNGKQHEELKQEDTKKLTNRAIVARVLRKLRSKGLIGGSHGPYDNVIKGFPGHDLERAKKSVDLLIKTGVLRSKSTSYGVRVSIESKEVGRVDSFLNGQPMGMHQVDEFAN